MLKIGIIGCGQITQVRHAPEYSENPACRIMGWYDVKPENAQAMADQYGGKVMPSVQALLDMGLDAVSVCVANRAHAEVTIAALNAGCHVLCEKPMATTLEECEAMLAASRKAGKRLMLGHNQRLAPAHVEARRLIETGELGRPLAFHTTFAHPGPEGWTGLRDSWFFHRNQAAFGVLADLGIHKTDLIHYLLGERIVKVSAMMGAVHKTYPDGRPVDVDDNAICLYQLHSGAMGHMHVSWTNYGVEENSTRLYFEKGVMRLMDDPEYALIVERGSNDATRLKLGGLTSNEDQTSGKRENTGVIDAFVNGVQTGAPTVLDAEETIAAMRVVFQAIESARRGITLPVEHPKAL